jgi:hypothetical protein
MTSLSDILKTRVRNSWRYEIDIDLANISKQTIDAWCEKNLKNCWKSSNLYLGYFRINIEDDSDYLMFTLRWGDKCDTN